MFFCFRRLIFSQYLTVSWTSYYCQPALLQSDSWLKSLPILCFILQWRQTIINSSNKTLCPASILSPLFVIVGKDTKARRVCIFQMIIICIFRLIKQNMIFVEFQSFVIFQLQIVTIANLQIKPISNTN